MPSGGSEDRLLYSMKRRLMARDDMVVGEGEEGYRCARCLGDVGIAEEV